MDFWTIVLGVIAGLMIFVFVVPFLIMLIQIPFIIVSGLLESTYESYKSDKLQFCLISAFLLVFFSSASLTPTTIFENYVFPIMMVTFYITVGLTLWFYYRKKKKNG